jgi:hypothetical protein
MRHLRLIATTAVVPRHSSRNPLDSWLNNWLRKGASSRAKKGAFRSLRRSNLEVISPRSLPHRLLQRSTCRTPSFPDHPLTTTELRGWSGNFGVHNKKEWVGEG